MPENSVQPMHDFVLENRQKATMTGINDVESFDEEAILAKSECGSITIRGRELKISRLSVESGDMVVEGEIDSIVYSENRTAGGFFSRVFK